MDVPAPAAGVAVHGSDDDKVIYTVPIVPSASGARNNPSDLVGDYADIDFTSTRTGAAAAGKKGGKKGAGSPAAAAADEQVSVIEGTRCTGVRL